jgi:hypothetical protein
VPELPSPLPPGERPVGQLVAESLRLYGANFWRALPLGLPLAIATEVNLGRSINVQIVVFCLGAPLFSAAFVRGSQIALGLAPPRRRILFAWLLGALVWIPAPPLLRVYIIPGLAWLAFWGLAVPVALREGLGAKASLGRARRLAVADYAHALGSLCTLVLVVGLSGVMLSALLHSQGDATRRSAAFLAPLVLSPLLYLGAALLYLDQAARVGSSRSERRRRDDAHLHPPLDPDPAGRPDLIDGRTPRPCATRGSTNMRASWSIDPLQ